METMQHHDSIVATWTPISRRGGARPRKRTTWNPSDKGSSTRTLEHVGVMASLPTKLRREHWPSVSTRLRRGCSPESARVGCGADGDEASAPHAHAAHNKPTVRLPHHRPNTVERSGGVSKTVVRERRLPRGEVNALENEVKSNGLFTRRRLPSKYLPLLKIEHAYS